MIISLAKLRPHPFRDYNLDPLDSELVEDLKGFIAEFGLCGGSATLVARRSGTAYELARGAHALEAAKQLGITKGEVTIMP